MFYCISSISTTIIEGEPIQTTINHKTSSTIIKEIQSYNYQLKCLTCNDESSSLNLCIKCNIEKEYYPSIIKDEIYLECYNKETKPSNFYLNKITLYYESCYSKCKTCDVYGDEEINNC